jgi:hypothetical protein
MDLVRAVLAAALALTAAPAAMAADAPERSSVARDYLVGVYYFAGWWRELPNKYHTAGRDWRLDYPERVPLLGEYNEQETMDREIAAAADYGVSFFQILWYPPRADAPPSSHEDKLNEGLRTFLASPNNHRLKLTMEFVNHPPFGITTDDAWEAACREWCRAMTHPSYLRVGGRPVFKVHSIQAFLDQCGGDQTQVAARLATFRRIARDSGLTDPLIGGGSMAGGVPSAESAAPYDFLSTYMDVPNLPAQEQPYPYPRLLAQAEDAWRLYAASASKPYLPYLAAGWDPRPWKDPRPSFALPTREQWTDALRRAEAALDDSPKLGIVTADGVRHKLLLIYAWNEFGEGGIVAPTRGDGYMKLEAIKAVFGGAGGGR